MQPCRVGRSISFKAHVLHLSEVSVLASVRQVTLGQVIGAILILALTAAVLLGARWALRVRDPLNLTSDPGTQTRVLLVQRMVVVAILIIGLALAAAQLGILDSLATSVLGSAAIVTVIVGFAARAVLANGVAGVMMAITQPVRVGDHVQIGDHAGVVEDLSLNATVLRTVNGTRIRVPNEQLAQSVVLNDSIVDAGVLPEAHALLPLGADLTSALELARGLPGVTIARIAAILPDGWAKLIVRGEVCSPADRVPAEARLRLALVEGLRIAGLLERQDPQDHAQSADSAGQAAPHRPTPA